jgi:hypothetical protein
VSFCIGLSGSHPLDARVETNTPTWAASTVRDQTSRAKLVKADRIVRAVVDRLSVSDVDRWHARLRKAGAVTPRSAISTSCFGRRRRWRVLWRIHREAASCPT